MAFSIIIPSRNTKNLAVCVRAIRRANETARVIVMDDGLDRNVWSDCTLQVCACPKPFIFARNVNAGIRWAGTDDVLLLNDDALLETPRGFSLMSECLMDYNK